MASRRATISFALLQVALGAAVLAGLWFAWPGWRLGMVTEQVRMRYPGVPLFATADLGAWLEDVHKSKPAIVDVRSQPEFDMSHIAGAVRIDPAGDFPPVELPEDHRRVIIIYCSTGERSAPFATRLQEAGYSRVFVLEGGLVRWANEGRPLTDGKFLVTRVHPGDRRATQYLSRTHRAKAPAIP